MNTLIYLPTLLIEWMKANLLHVRYYKPSTEAVRIIENNSRNEARLAAYHLKRAVYGK